MIKRFVAPVLTCIGIGSMVASMVLVAKETPKANEILAQAEKDADEGLSTMEKVKIQTKNYAPAIATAAAGIAAVILGQVASAKQIAALSGAAGLAAKKLYDERNYVKKKFKDVRKEVDAELNKERKYAPTGDDTVWVHDTFLDMDYKATTSDIRKAADTVSRYLCKHQSCPAYLFYKNAVKDRDRKAMIRKQVEMLAWDGDDIVKQRKDSSAPVLHPICEYDLEKREDSGGYYYYVLTFTVDPIHMRVKAGAA